MHSAWCGCRPACRMVFGRTATRSPETAETDMLSGLLRSAANITSGVVAELRQHALRAQKLQESLSRTVHSNSESLERTVTALIQSTKAIERRLSVASRALREHVRAISRTAPDAKSSDTDFHELTILPREQPSNESPTTFMVTIPSKDTTRQRRTSPRYVFRERQCIAPVYGGELCPPFDFREVQFCDLSSEGTSFVLDSEPDFDKVIVRLRNNQNLTDLLAEVVRVSMNDKRQHVVACRFVKRL